MLRKGNDCWIKVVPLISKSNPSSLHFILNSEEHHWDIYDKYGCNVHIVYVQGKNIEPSVCLRSGQRFYKIHFKINGIKVIKISKDHDINLYIKNNCNSYSSETKCWAIAIFHTREMEKPPFDII